MAQRTRSGREETSAASTFAPASACGRCIRFPRRASSATRRGETTQRRTAAARTSGRTCRPTKSSASSICRSARPPTIGLRRPSAGRQPVCRKPGRARCAHRQTRVAFSGGASRRVDYDFPPAPVLIDVRVNGKDIKAVAQVSKQGFTYVFDRKTGTPVWPIEERPVPQSTAPGERTSPTQPFPTSRRRSSGRASTENDLIDFTPELRQLAIEAIKPSTTGRSSRRRSEKGTIADPGWAGGANWAGAAVDPETGTLYVPSMTSPIVVQLVKPDPKLSNLLYVRGGVMMPPSLDGLPSSSRRTGGSRRSTCRRATSSGPRPSATARANIRC